MPDRDHRKGIITLIVLPRPNALSNYAPVQLTLMSRNRPRRVRAVIPCLDATADHTAVPRVTFTDPEIASVGLSEAAARARGIDVIVASADPAESARGSIHDFHRGALTLVADRERGVLIGAMLVTPRAGEIVGELVLAIKLGTPLKTLADVIHPFPAFNRVLGESLEQLAAKMAPHSTARS